MTSEEIKSFLQVNEDLFDKWLKLDYDDVPELLKRLFESQEYKAFTERQRWQRAKAVFYSVGIDKAKELND